MTAALLLPLFAHAVEFSEEQIGEVRVTVCRVDVRRERLQLFLRDEAGVPLKRLSHLAEMVAGQGRRLVFAVNAGMYQGDLSPVGLFVADGRQMNPLNTRNAWGNFFLKPNGVFLVTDAGARVVETSEYPAVRGKVLLATQSGPLLVHRGELHPKFTADSVSKLYRNGVGIGPGGQAIFAITEGPVNFYQFATFYRDTLKCREALFLDGNISSLYAPALKRNDSHMDLGPMLGVTE